MPKYREWIDTTDLLLNSVESFAMCDREIDDELVGMLDFVALTLNVSPLPIASTFHAHEWLLDLQCRLYGKPEYLPPIPLERREPNPEALLPFVENPMRGPVLPGHVSAPHNANRQLRDDYTRADRREGKWKFLGE